MGVSDALQYEEEVSPDSAPTISDEEMDTLKKRMAALDKLLAEQQKAKYKIELLFTHQRSRLAPYPGLITLWESGLMLHGGGDAIMYHCPSEKNGHGTCRGIIPFAGQGCNKLVCPKCQVAWEATDSNAANILECRLTTDGWARVLYRYFIDLSYNADICVKVPKYDLRKMATLEQEHQHMGEKLGKARDRIVYVYPLKNIIKDTSNGAELLGRFKAMLSA